MDARRIDVWTKPITIACLPGHEAGVRQAGHEHSRCLPVLRPGQSAVTAALTGSMKGLTFTTSTMRVIMVNVWRTAARPLTPPQSL
jgi:hypothetical protein